MTMSHIQLSQAQTSILSTACDREDGLVFPVTAKLKGGAVGNVCKSLLKHGLIKEVVAADDNTVWRHDTDRGPITLRATTKAQIVLGITEAPKAEAIVQHREGKPDRQHHGSKQAVLIAMLQAEGGATIAEIAAALGWQPHTSRGVLSGVLKKKLGLIITSEKIEGRGRAYKITTP
jgi:hypothetical protein